MYDLSWVQDEILPGIGLAVKEAALHDPECPLSNPVMTLKGGQHCSGKRGCRSGIAQTADTGGGSGRGSSQKSPKSMTFEEIEEEILHETLQINQEYRATGKMPDDTPRLRDLNAERRSRKSASPDPAQENRIARARAQEKLDSAKSRLSNLEANLADHEREIPRLKKEWESRVEVLRTIPRGTPERQSAMDAESGAHRRHETAVLRREQTKRLIPQALRDVLQFEEDLDSV